MQVSDDAGADLRQGAAFIIPDVFLQRRSRRVGLSQQVVIDAIVEQRRGTLDELLCPVAIEAVGVLVSGDYRSSARSRQSSSLVELEVEAIGRQGVTGGIQRDRAGRVARHPVESE